MRHRESPSLGRMQRCPELTYSERTLDRRSTCPRHGIHSCSCYRRYPVDGNTRLIKKVVTEGTRRRLVLLLFIQLLVLLSLQLPFHISDELSDDVESETALWAVQSLPSATSTA